MNRLNPKYTIIFLHAFTWALLFTLPHFLINNQNPPPGALPGLFYTISNLYHVGLFYLNVLVLYPLLFTKRRWWLFALAAGIIMAGSYYAKLGIIREWLPWVQVDKWTYRMLFFPPLPFLIVSTVYCLVADKIAHDRKQKEIVAEQLAMKLKFLRSQISPHFIFNVLTNLVSLARKRSEQLEPLLIKLSELMRYILYDSDEKKVSLSKEVEYLKSYIDLQNLRFGHDVRVDIDIDLPATESERLIEPMLLIPFVENAFKHGMGIEQAFIIIHLEVTESILDFDVKNRFNDDITESKDASSGIGLENVKSRLALLYPGRHFLSVKKQNDQFHVHLTLQLK
ncbi:MAG TPA: histidine kinase [Chitinophagaceae bacterium]|jgi:hypothetical protein